MTTTTAVKRSLKRKHIKTRTAVQRSTRIKKVKNNIVKNIIFLDIDGVLNYMPENIRKYLALSAESFYGFNKNNVDNLKTILDTTDARIVISSTWRHYTYYTFIPEANWRDILAERLGRDRSIFIGETPDCSADPYVEIKGKLFYARRGREIKTWMVANKDTYGEPLNNYNFCIIDDMVNDIEPVFSNRNILHTNPITGLTKEDITRVYHILNYAKPKRPV